jgi:hypothetical protein
VYVGTMGDEALCDTVVGWLVNAASVSSTLVTPEGVEAVERWKNGRRTGFESVRRLGGQLRRVLGHLLFCTDPHLCE